MIPKESIQLHILKSANVYNYRNELKIQEFIGKLTHILYKHTWPIAYTLYKQNDQQYIFYKQMYLAEIFYQLLIEFIAL